MIDLPFDAQSGPSCDVCLKEIPVSAAASAEGVEYVLHFFGIECYDQWHRQLIEPDKGDSR